MGRKTALRVGLAVFAVAAACRAQASSSAESAARFYHGKTLEIDVGTGPGGGYDANARLVAANLGRFIPGHPTVIVNNLPGGGGIRAANELYNTAARDGSVISTFSNAMITEPLLGAGQAKFKPADLTWIGSVSREDGVCVASAKSGVKTWGDLLKKPLVVGADAPGTTTYMYPEMLKNLFGARFRLVSGYPDGGQIALALERGEVQAICQTYSSLRVGHADWLRDHLVYPLVTLGLSRIPDLPATPSVLEFAKNEKQQQMLKLILAPTLAGRPFAAPPSIPPDRAEALRSAFLAMTHDPQFLKEAARRRIDVTPEGGADVEALVRQIYGLPQATIAETKAVVSGAGQSQ